MRKLSLLRWLIAGVIVSFSGSASAQLVQTVAVGVCQAASDAYEIEFSGASFLMPSNHPTTLFHCPIDAAAAPPGAITSATVWLGDANQNLNASAQLCFTDLNASPNEVCGPLSYSSGFGYFVQALQVTPPSITLKRTHAAFLKIEVPGAVPAGYGFLRGFRVD